MLQSLRIRNYALIQQADIDLQSGFTAITGETGAGKSILLEALSLVLGARANYQSIRYGENKCYVELEASYQSSEIEELLKAWELDSAETILLRRELNSSKRSRAFINDTPVTLQQLTEVGRKLVDLHGQQENIALQTSGYQIQQLDHFATNEGLVTDYQQCFKHWKSLVRQKAEMEARAEQLRKDKDYFAFQFNELEEAKLDAEEYNSLEDQLGQLEHAEEIQGTISQAVQLMDDAESGLLEQLRRVEHLLSDVSRYSTDINSLKERAGSCSIELRDILAELEDVASKTEADPQQLEFLRDRMDTYNKLLHKHGLSELEELIQLRDSFDEKLRAAENFEEDQAAISEAVTKSREELDTFGQKLSANRQKAAVQFGKHLTAQIRELGMPKGCVEVKVSRGEEARADGFDEVVFLFNANASEPLVPLANVASGGEISRVMLAIKSLNQSVSGDFTVIFDEIDTGVSGEVAAQIGKLMKSIGAKSQVIAVTHLPGVASKADVHLKVFKTDQNGTVVSNARYISQDERVEELASMFSGDARSEAALESARTMLGD